MLTVIDDSGNSFAADQATSYCAEDAYTRLARDIVVRTASNTFLVRKCGEAEATERVLRSGMRSAPSSTAGQRTSRRVTTTPSLRL